MKANKQWTWISQIQWHRSLEFHLSDRFLNQSRYRTQYALNISPWCQLGIREKEDGRPSVFPCYFRESSVVCTTQRDTKGVHAKEDPDKEIGCLNQTQTWRHAFRHSPTLMSQSSCYHPREERDHKTKQESFCTKYELVQKKTWTPREHQVDSSVAFLCLYLTRVTNYSTF